MVEWHNRWYERSRARSGLPARLVTLALKDLTHARKGRAVTGVPLGALLTGLEPPRAEAIVPAVPAKPGHGAS
jgi:hypothetical protein